MVMFDSDEESDFFVCNSGHYIDCAFWKWETRTIIVVVVCESIFNSDRRKSTPFRC